METLEQLEQQIEELESKRAELIGNEWEKIKQEILSLEWLKDVKEFVLYNNTGLFTVRFYSEWLTNKLEYCGHSLLLSSNQEDSRVYVNDSCGRAAILRKNECYFDSNNLPYFSSFLKSNNINVSLHEDVRDKFDFINGLMPKLICSKQ